MTHKGMGAGLLLACAWILVDAVSAQAAGTSPGPSRVDFDERLIKGQRASTGGIYIFARQSVELGDMVQKPKSYRQRIIKTVFEE